jgi:hypothetical protein
MSLRPPAKKKKKKKKLELAKVSHFLMRETPLAHELIQSWQSVGKIVCTTSGRKRD